MSVALRIVVLLVATGVLLPGGASVAVAAETSPRYGIALLAGQAYDPERFGLVIIQGNVQLPYAEVFWHDAPASLFFQGEINLGLTTDGRDRALVAVNMMAVKYLENWTLAGWTPYLEGGIGLVYTDFQVKGQGLRVNFNPQIGGGGEWSLPCGRVLAVGLRLHHLSNADFHRDNRGINSIFALVGLRF